MSANIPAGGINAYMDSEKLKHLPPNGAWRLQQWVHCTWRWWVAVLAMCFAGVFVFDYSRGATLVFARTTTEPFVSAVFYEAFVFVGTIALLFYLLVAVPARPPGQWRRYSLKDFAEHYGTWHIPEFEAVIHATRKGYPGADFEIAALEAKYPSPGLKPVYHGLVLFQISNRVGQVFDTDGIGLRVCSSTGNHMTFDLQAAPAGAL